MLDGFRRVKSFLKQLGDNFKQYSFGIFILVLVLLTPLLILKFFGGYITASRFKDLLEVTIPLAFLFLTASAFREWKLKNRLEVNAYISMSKQDAFDLALKLKKIFESTKNLPNGSEASQFSDRDIYRLDRVLESIKSANFKIISSGAKGRLTPLRDKLIRLSQKIPRNKNRLNSEDVEELDIKELYFDLIAAFELREKHIDLVYKDTLSEMPD